jgi:hypothetical protein
MNTVELVEILVEVRKGRVIVTRLRFSFHVAIADTLVPRIQATGSISTPALQRLKCLWQWLKGNYLDIC